MPNLAAASRLALAGLAVAAGAGCELSTAATGPTADVVGSWAYTGAQTAPAIQLEGTLAVIEQVDGTIAGSLTWTERDALGNLQLRGAQVSGRVIGLEDADFDVLATPNARRHVARISVNGDTMVGVWASLEAGVSGSFRAVRGAR